MINSGVYAAGTYLVSVDFMNLLYCKKLIKL